MVIWRRENIHQHVNGTAPDNGVTEDELKAARIEARQKMMQNLRDRQLQIKPVTVAPVSAAEPTKK